MITCSACGGTTKEKQINTKFGLKTVGECLCGCKNDKGYPLGTFAPRPRTAQAPVGAVQRPPQVGAVADMLRELQESKAVQLAMNAKLTGIIALLQKLTAGKSAPVQMAVPSEDYQESEKNELEPDEETPF